MYFDSFNNRTRIAIDITIVIIQCLNRLHVHRCCAQVAKNVFKTEIKMNWNEYYLDKYKQYLSR